MRLTLIFVALCLLLAGCGHRSTKANVSSETTEASSDFAGRLEAAKAIFDSNKRDSALVTVSLDAANAGEGEVAKAAVASIFDSNAKDDAAYNAAVALAKAGKGQEAKAVADLIFDSNRRDSALAKIASGS